MPSSPLSSPSEAGGPGPDTRLVVPALATWAGTWVATSGRTWLVATLVLAILGTATWWWVSRWRPSRPAPRVGPPQRRPGAALAALTLCLAAGLSIGAGHAAMTRTGPVAEAARHETRATIRVHVTSEPLPWGPAGPVDGEDQRGSGLWARGTMLRLSVPGGRGPGVDGVHVVRAPVLVIVPNDAAAAWARLPLGTTMEFPARLSAPDHGSELAAIATVAGPARAVREPGPGLGLVNSVRGGLREAVADRPPGPRALVPALVLGDTAAVPADMEDDFLAAGMLHLLAVSGSNLTLLLAFLLGIAKAVGVRGRWLYVVSLGGVVVFVVLCRSEPSVLRAAAMGLVGLVGLAAAGSGARGAGVRSACVAIIVLLLVDPWLARSHGFALSVVATLAIVVWAGPWADRLQRHVPRWAAEALCVPLAAQVATTPIAAMLSGRVSLVGLVANVAAGPLVGLATVAGFLTAGISQAWMPLAEFASRPASWCAQAILWVAHAGARVPGAEILWPADPLGIAALAVACAGTAVLVPHVLVRRRRILVVLVVMVLVLARGTMPPGYPPREWVLAACDVGQGNALVIPTGPASAILVDTGTAGSGVTACLHRLGVRRLPVLVLSHLHDDHAGALSEVLAAIEVGAVVVPEGPIPETGHVPVAVSRAGHHFVVGSGEQMVQWQTLAPRGAAGPEGPTTAGTGPRTGSGDGTGVANDASLVARVTVRGTRILLTGDLEAEGQQRVMRAGTDVGADVLVVPHHGSRNQDRAFLAATGARVAVVSVGRDNDYGHPHPDTLAILRSAGMHIARTDETGDVVITRR